MLLAHPRIRTVSIHTCCRFLLLYQSPITISTFAMKGFHSQCVFPNHYVKTALTRPTPSFVAPRNKLSNATHAIVLYRGAPLSTALDTQNLGGPTPTSWRTSLLAGRRLVKCVPLTPFHKSNSAAAVAAAQSYWCLCLSVCVYLSRRNSVQQPTYNNKYTQKGSGRRRRRKFTRFCRNFVCVWFLQWLFRQSI